MDDYIKRKLYTPAKPVQTRIQTVGEVKIRQTKQQVEHLITKLEYITSRAQYLRQSLKQIQIERIEKEKPNNIVILDSAPSYLPQGENSVLNRKAQTSNQIVQQNLKLESTEGMVNQVAPIQPLKRQAKTFTQKLPQLGKRVGRKRRT